MKKLVLVRHAKSLHHQNLQDIDRPLSEKGVQDAIRVANYCVENLGYTPQYWLSSSATRALHTACIFARTFKCTNQLKISEKMYTFSPVSLQYNIQEIPNSVDSAILFGHNDALWQTVIDMNGKHVSMFKTCSVAHFNLLDNDWKEFTNAKLLSIYDKSEI